VPVDLQERREQLRRVELFRGLDDGELDEVAALAGELEFAPNAVIARQGQVETGFFLVVSGRVQVTHGGKELASLGPGEFFGELTVIDQQPRLASVVAAEQTVCLALASWDLLRLLES
jgi:CRP/FNR family transcriptional regulator, cyclic AMP receptor protein